MIIERIRIQRRIKSALSASRQVKLKAIPAAEIALKQLNSALHALERFNKRHSFLSKILSCIDRRFCFLPLTKEINRLNRLSMKVAQKAEPIILPKPLTPEPAVQIAEPVQPPRQTEDKIIKKILSEGSPAQVQETSLDIIEQILREGPPPQVQETSLDIIEQILKEGPPANDQTKLLEKAQAFKVKFDRYFSNIENLNENFDKLLAKREPQQTIQFLDKFEAFFDKYGKIFQSDESFDDFICQSESFEVALQFLERVYGSEPTPESDQKTVESLNAIMTHKLQLIEDVGRYLLKFFRRQLFVKNIEEENKTFIPTLVEMAEEVNDNKHILGKEFKRAIACFKLKGQLLAILKKHRIDLFGNKELFQWYNNQFFMLEPKLRTKFLEALAWRLDKVKKAKAKQKIVELSVEHIQDLVTAFIYEKNTIPKLMSLSTAEISQKMPLGLKAMKACQLNTNAEQAIDTYKQFMNDQLPQKVQDPVKLKEAQEKIQCLIDNLEQFG